MWLRVPGWLVADVSDERNVQGQAVQGDYCMVLNMNTTQGHDSSSSFSSSSSSWRYSPGRALTSSTIRLHSYLSLAFSIHPLIPILLRSAITSSSHLILGLLILFVAYSFPFSTLLGMAISTILSTWPSHCIFVLLWIWLYLLLPWAHTFHCYILFAIPPYLPLVHIQCVPLATEPGISLIILTPIKISQEYVRCVRNEKECVCSVCL